MFDLIPLPLIYIFVGASMMGYGVKLFYEVFTLRIQEIINVSNQIEFIFIKKMIYLIPSLNKW
jgi:hypothetical protein